MEAAVWTGQVHQDRALRDARRAGSSDRPPLPRPPFSDVERNVGRAPGDAACGCSSALSLPLALAELVGMLMSALLESSRGFYVTQELVYLQMSALLRCLRMSASARLRRSEIGRRPCWRGWWPSGGRVRRVRWTASACGGMGSDAPCSSLY